MAEFRERLPPNSGRSSRAKTLDSIVNLIMILKKDNRAFSREIESLKIQNKELERQL
jgi:hypothetical protein